MSSRNKIARLLVSLFTALVGLAIAQNSFGFRLGFIHLGMSLAFAISTWLLLGRIKGRISPVIGFALLVFIILTYSLWTQNSRRAENAKRSVQIIPDTQGRLPKE